MPLPSLNTTQIPNVVFDHWMGVLSPAEFKVLLCVCRKTYGWHKERDRLSRAQIVKLTNLGRDAVRKALASLEGYGLLKKFQSISEYGDNDPNTYEIHVEDIPPEGWASKKPTGGLLKSPPGGLLRSPTKERHIQNKDVKSCKTRHAQAREARPAGPSQARACPVLKKEKEGVPIKASHPKRCVANGEPPPVTKTLPTEEMLPVPDEATLELKAPQTFQKVKLTGEYVTADLSFYLNYRQREKLPECDFWIIQLAWNELFKYNRPVTDWQRFLDGTIENLLERFKRKKCKNQKDPTPAGHISRGRVSQN